MPSVLAGFHATPLSRLNWNLEMLGAKPENTEKNPESKARSNNKLNPYVILGWNRTQATLVGGKYSHHCTIPTPLEFYPVKRAISASHIKARQ